jgi:hypothetical protein
MENVGAGKGFGDGYRIICFGLRPIAVAPKITHSECIAVESSQWGMIADEWKLQILRHLDSLLQLRVFAFSQSFSRNVSGRSGDNAVVFEHPSLPRQIASHR